MIKNILKTLCVSISLMAMAATPVFAAKPVSQGRTAPPAPTNIIGNDVSWPQCSDKSLPGAQYFGVVGANDGLANNTNPCFSTQLKWTSKAAGTSNQSKVQLYVSTANPAGLGVSDWPTSNVGPNGITASDPYGTCNGSNSLACAWQYGWNMAVNDNTIRLKPAAQTAGLSTNGGNYAWWLDVETDNTWLPAGVTFNYQSNTADLEGMTNYFDSLGAKVGLYSTAVQWSEIVGSAVSSTSPLNGLANWRPSGSSLKTAQTNCSVAPLTTGGFISLTQYTSKTLDYDYSCIN